MFNPSIETLHILNGIFLLFLLVSMYKSFKLFISWDSSSVSSCQYENEKTSYLLSTIIKYLLFFKIPLFIFFVFILDGLSRNFIGAMCAAGVVDNLDFGMSLLIFKLVNLFLLGFWIVLHNKDIALKELPYSKTKFGYFLIVGLFLCIEIGLETYTLLKIDTHQVVQCCGTIFSKASTSYIGYLFLIDTSVYVYLFYIIFLLLVWVYFIKNKTLFAFLNVLFLVISLISLILFFGTYIYELPTHHCPFCFLQKEYNYIGYLLYVLLFSGTFLGIASELKNYMKSALILNTLYVLIVSYYFISYFLKNGVLL